MTLVQAVAIAGVRCIQQTFFRSEAADTFQAGRIGGPIVEALLDAGFTVTVLTRDESRLANKQMERCKHT